MTLRVCLEAWGGDPNALVALARHAERAGIDGVYLGESPTALNAETWSTLGAIAVSTERIRIGPVIANLLPTYRSPVLLARHGAALARLSGGRFDFRSGVGAERAAGARWWAAAGVDYPGYDDRLVEAERQLGIIKNRWAGPDGVGAGPELDRLQIEVTIAATSQRSLGLAARLADRWETSFATVDEWRERAGRSPIQLRNSLEIDGFIGTRADPDLIWRIASRERAGERLEAIHARALVGSPERVADQIDDLREAGVEQLVVALHDPHDLDAVDRLATAVRLSR